LVFSEKQSVKKSLKLFKKILTLEKSGKAKIMEFALPQGYALNSFIEKYVADSGGLISKAAVERLASLVGRDQAERVKTSAGYGQKQVYNLWQVASELDKLLTFRQDKEIVPDDVEALVLPRVEDNVFSFTDALGRKSTKEALKLLSLLLDTKGKTAAEQQGNAIMVVGALASQLRSLLLYREVADSRGPQDIVQTLGWNPYRARAVGQLASRFKAPELKEAIERLLKIDLQLKSDTVSPQVLLSMFVVQTSKIN